MQESKPEIPDENDIDEPDTKEADVTVNKYFGNIESIVNEEKPNKFGYDDDDFDDKNWSRFVGGYKDSNYLRILNETERRGLAAPNNMDFIDYLRIPQCCRVMEEDNISIHVNSSNFIVGETDVGESIYNFLQLQNG